MIEIRTKSPLNLKFILVFIIRLYAPHVCIRYIKVCIVAINKKGRVPSMYVLGRKCMGTDSEQKKKKWPWALKRTSERTGPCMPLREV